MKNAVKNDQWNYDLDGSRKRHCKLVPEWSYEEARVYGSVHQTAHTIAGTRMHRRQRALTPCRRTHLSFRRQLDLGSSC
eukprot:6175534-Pleurochrysis_carterae.AAC.3